MLLSRRLSSVTLMVCMLTLTLALSVGCRRSPAADGVPSGPDEAETYAFYDNGEMGKLSGLEIEQLINDAQGDTRCRLGPDWDQSPGYAARYFTMNLLGITDQRADTWGQCASGAGNVISSSDGTNLGTYTGLFDLDRTSKAASVRLQTAKKKAYLITLRRPWPGGPWLVTEVSETKYISPP